MSTEQRLTKLDDSKQPSNRTVNNTLTSANYNYRKLSQEGNK